MLVISLEESIFSEIITSRRSAGKEAEKWSVGLDFILSIKRTLGRSVSDLQESIMYARPGTAIGFATRYSDPRSCFQYSPVFSWTANDGTKSWVNGVDGFDISFYMLEHGDRLGITGINIYLTPTHKTVNVYFPETVI